MYTCIGVEYNFIIYRTLTSLFIQATKLLELARLSQNQPDLNKPKHPPPSNSVQFSSQKHKAVLLFIRKASNQQSDVTGLSRTVNKNWRYQLTHVKTSFSGFQKPSNRDKSLSALWLRLQNHPDKKTERDKSCLGGRWVSRRVRLNNNNVRQSVRIFFGWTIKFL